MALIVVVVVVVMFVIVVVVVVPFLLVGDSLVIVVVVGAIALPPLRLSAVEISMGACSLLFLPLSVPLLHSQLELRVLQTFAQLFC